MISTATGIQAQTYIQGKSVIPFHEMAESELIRQSNRLSSQDALRLYNERIFPKGRKDRSEELPGEWWLIDNLLIKIVGRKLSHPPISSQNLEETRLSLSPEGPRTARYVQEYFDEIKTVNNFDIFVHYLKYGPNKYFLIRDKGNRYILRGTIYSADERDIRKAEEFVDTLLQSITFK